MEQKTHHNYVLCFADGRVKIGRTGNFNRRRRELGGFYNEGRPVSRDVALAVENILRRRLRPHALSGTFEWFRAPKSVAAEIVDLTARLQTSVEAIL
jgi:hypothetical protein